MGRMVIAGLGMLLATAGGMASAHAFNGAARIANGDLRTAEREIVAQRALYPEQVDLSLNLAAVYAHTGREADARRLYEAVLAQPDEELDLAAQRTSRAHAVAVEGLRRLRTDVAAR